MTQRTRFIDIEELPIASNICEQELREVTKLPKASIAHVTMQPGGVSLLHEHHETTEIYYVVRGMGILYHGDKAMRVNDDSYLVIPPHTPHKLRNLMGHHSLEHLVIATPPFDALDVPLLEDDGSEPAPYGPLPLPRAIRAKDGVLIHELMSEQERQTSDLSLAIGILEPGQTSQVHYNTESEEAYYVMNGEGRMVVEDKPFDMNAGSMLVVPKGKTRHLENWGQRKMKVLCIANPAFKEENFRRL